MIGKYPGENAEDGVQSSTVELICCICVGVPATLLTWKAAAGALQVLVYGYRSQCAITGFVESTHLILKLATTLQHPTVCQVCVLLTDSTSSLLLGRYTRARRERIGMGQEELVTGTPKYGRF